MHETRQDKTRENRAISPASAHLSHFRPSPPQAFPLHFAAHLCLPIADRSSASRRHRPPRWIVPYSHGRDGGDWRGASRHRWTALYTHRAVTADSEKLLQWRLRRISMTRPVDSTDGAVLNTVVKQSPIRILRYMRRGFVAMLHGSWNCLNIGLEQVYVSTTTRYCKSTLRSPSVVRLVLSCG